MPTAQQSLCRSIASGSSFRMRGSTKHTTALAGLLPHRSTRLTGTAPSRRLPISGKKSRVTLSAGLEAAQHCFA